MNNKELLKKLNDKFYNNNNTQNPENYINNYINSKSSKENNGEYKVKEIKNNNEPQKYVDL